MLIKTEKDDDQLPSRHSGDHIYDQAAEKKEDSSSPVIITKIEETSKSDPITEPDQSSPTE